MKQNSEALKQEPEMENVKAEEKNLKEAAQVHVQKIKPLKTTTQTPADPGCRPTGT